MTAKEIAHDLIDRIPDTEYAEKAIRQICAIAKKAGKETRCAPKRRDAAPPDLRDELLAVMIRNRTIR